MTTVDQVKIRQAELADAVDVASTQVASWHETYTGMLPAEILASLSVEERASMWAHITSGPATSASPAVYIAELDDRIIGFGSCSPQRTEELRRKGFDGEFSAIYVLKAYQRQAVGRRLLMALASELTSKGYGSASLWVLQENTSARQFYERYGAQAIAEKEEMRNNAVLTEVAYGWKELRELIRGTAI